jgi:hypothetical protein
MGARRILGVVTVCGVLAGSAAAAAQQAGGSIGGVARDTTGAVMPGVTVEAASPALIEKLRSTVTDDQGRYQIIDLRPGTYAVTFTLPGFSTFVRDGLELTSGFTATVNAELRVGSLEETVTVTGESPLVDIRSVRQQVQLSRDTLESIPGTGRLPALYQVLPAAVLNVATAYSVGAVNERVAANYNIHGAPSASPVFDGMNATVTNLTQGVVVYNQLTFQEVVVETGGISAERDSGGAQVNIVQRDGGNTFSGALEFFASGPSLESSNIGDALRARGASASGALRRFYDTGGALGGPIVRNRLWFFGAVRTGVTQQFQAGNAYNRLQNQAGLAPGVLLYEPDPGRPSFTDEYARDYTLRLTWQAAAKHKIAFAASHQPNCNCLFGLLNPGVIPSPESTGQHHYNPNFMPLASWTYPMTNRILLEAGASGNLHHKTSKRIPGVTPDMIQITEQARNFKYGSRANSLAVGGSYSHNPRRLYQSRAAASYVTGAHNFKTGFNVRVYHEGNLLKNRDPNQINQARDYTFRNGLPVSVRVWAVPHGFEEAIRDVAWYAQDQWTIQRATLNFGLRFNDVRAWTPEQVLVAGPFVPERRLAPTNNVPHFRNLDPRLGVAYDVFGTGRTAVKASLGRYSEQLIRAVENPARAMAENATRTWNDNFYPVGDPRRGNFVPDCVLGPSVSGANGECGPLSDLSFGGQRPGTRFGDDALEGFNAQNYNWQASASLQHELAAGVGLSVAYYRTWYGGFLVRDNLALSPADFDTYCITAPSDRRLPTSGQQICGFYDVKPALFGRVDNLVSKAESVGEPSQVYNGVDLTANARFGNGGQAQGGLSVGRTVTDTCYANDDPSLTPQAFVNADRFPSYPNFPDFPTPAVTTVARSSAFCRIVPTWASSTRFRGLFVYPLKWDFQASVVYQDIPGIPVTASHVVSNAEVRGSLGRDLAACRGAATCNANVVVELMPMSNQFEDRLHQIDLRFTRSLRAGQMRLRVNFDIYNVFNAGDVLRSTDRYGASWLNAVQIMGGRLIKLGAHFDF